MEEVNKKLDGMGHNIGCRLVEDFLAKTNTQKCGDFRDTAEVGPTFFNARNVIPLNLNTSLLELSAAPRVQRRPAKWRAESTRVLGTL